MELTAGLDAVGEEVKGFIIGIKFVLEVVGLLGLNIIGEEVVKLIVGLEVVGLEDSEVVGHAIGLDVVGVEVIWLIGKFDVVRLQVVEHVVGHDVIR